MTFGIGVFGNSDPPEERVLSGEADGEMVVLRGLRKVFPSRRRAGPKVAVQDLYFGIPEGECLGFLGLNGAGKTTTMTPASSNIP
eukprot:s6089_g3.t1